VFASGSCAGLVDVPNSAARTAPLTADRHSVMQSIWVDLTVFERSLKVLLVSVEQLLKRLMEPG